MAGLCRVHDVEKTDSQKPCRAIECTALLVTPDPRSIVPRWLTPMGVHGPARTFRDIPVRGEVIYLYGCCGFNVHAVAIDEPPWDQFLDRPIQRFHCPASRRPIDWHFHYGPGTPSTKRFRTLG